jgi:hypothetical protein
MPQASVDHVDSARLSAATHEAASATSTLIGAAAAYQAKPSDKSLQQAMGTSANQA